MDSELIFLVEESSDGGYIAKGLGVPIFTEADNVSELKINILDAVHCHFETEDLRPKVIRLHYVKEEVLAYA